MSNTLKYTMDHATTGAATGTSAPAEGRATMNARERTPIAFDRMTCGESRYASVSLLLDERMRIAAEARRAEDGARRTSLRSRTGRAIVALGTRVGGLGLDRPASDTLPSPTVPRAARAGRAG